MKNCNCGSEFKSIGGIGKDYFMYNPNGELNGIRELHIFQCGHCKTIIID